MKIHPLLCFAFFSILIFFGLPYLFISFVAADWLWFSGMFAEWQKADRAFFGLGFFALSIVACAVSAALWVDYERY